MHTLLLSNILISGGQDEVLHSFHWSIALRYSVKEDKKGNERYTWHLSFKSSYLGLKCLDEFSNG